MTHPGEPVAIIGWSCRLPGAPDVEAFAALGESGGAHAGGVPPGRRLPGSRHPDGSPVTGAYLESVADFDPAFFGLSPREAAAVDPQQRLLLELAWEACEHARLPWAELARAGVFVGAMNDDWARLVDTLGPDHLSPHSLTGRHRSLLANRVSHVLGLHGPSLTVDSGQSSSLIAAHLACESLRRGEARVALAGGVNLALASASTEEVARFGALSPDDRCYTFDERANGYLRGEGGAVVVLKPLAAARADGDRVLAVVLGGAMNHDGATDHLTRPDPGAQTAVVRAAVRAAGVVPEEIGYVELHGTGTPVGDPVEAAALAEALAENRGVDDPLPVSSAKALVGHLEGAAGIVGLLRAALAVHHRRLPGLADHSPDPVLVDRRLRVLRAPRDWPGDGQRVLAGVSSFGMGGSNCHLVLEAPEDLPDDRPVPVGTRPAPPWVIAARTAEGLADRAAALLPHAGADAHDVALSLATTRAPLPHRAAVSGDDRSGALEALVAGRRAPGLVRGRDTGGRCALLFSGQGFQRRGMGRDLATASPVFAAGLDDACAAIDPHLGHPLRDVLWAEEGSPLDLVDRTAYTQPALFAVEVALARLASSWGLHADVVAGHSVGEFAAAVTAGLLDLGDAARLVAARGAAMDALPAGGVMVAVQAPEREVRAAVDAAAVGDEVAVAAVNGPTAVVLSGAADPVEAVVGTFREQGRRTRRLTVSHAFHSPLMEPALAGIRGAATGLVPAPGTGPTMISTLTGGPVDAARLADPEYWVEHARRPVRFAEAVAAAHALDVRVFAEVGPGHGLSVLGRDLGLPGAAFVPLLDLHDEVGGTARAQGALWTHGADLDWVALCGPGATRVDLPGPRYRRERYWPDELPETRTTVAGAADGGPVVTTPPAAPPAGAPVEEAAPPQPPDDAAPPAPDPADLVGIVVTELTEVLGHSDPAAVEEARPFTDAGLDSPLAVELRERLGERLGLDLPATLLFDHPNPRAAAAELHRRLTGSGTRTPSVEGPVAVAGDDPVVVVGMACRYPGGVRSPADLWALVEDGRDAIGPPPADRGWDDARDALGGFLDDADRFDPAFFGISPREAIAMDPQQRVLLETAWHAVEDAGLDPAELRDGPVGVYVGATSGDYGPRMHEGASGAEVPDWAGYLLTGTTTSVASGRIAYTLGLRGPALTIDTACSASLVAIHTAMRALRSGECTTALAGGVTVMSGPGMVVEFQRQQGLAADGRCKPFAAAADGTAWAEGAGMLVLTRLSTARAAGLEVRAVLRGSAVNSDGASNGLTAPNGPAQEAVLRAALADGGLTPADVDAVEAHGTGTRLGDPIEAGALLAVYGTERDRPLLLGSLKSNIGHAQAAAGVGGVIKTIEAIRHGRLPRTLHLDAPTPYVDWSAGTVALLDTARDWPVTGRPRRAGVSSFGVSGTNAHVLLEAAPDGAPAARPVRVPGPVPCLVTAPDEAALRAQAAGLEAALATSTDAVADVGCALAARPRHRTRAAVVAADRAGLRAGLRALAEGTPHAGLVTGAAGPDSAPVFVLPGQGSQWAGMGIDLLEVSPAFAARMAECDAAIAAVTGWSVLAVLRGEDGTPPADRVDVVQPLLFAMLVSLAELWRSVGVTPAAVVGHSQGEIAAACIAGALDLADAARVVSLRSRALRDVAGAGGMASVPLPVDDVRARCRDGIEVAAVNGPASTVVAGPAVALDVQVAALVDEGVDARRVNVDYASHTAAMEPLADRVRADLAGITPRGDAGVPIVSTRTGAPVDPATLDAEHWYASLRGTVEFRAAIEHLIEAGHRTFVEVSPHPVLTVGIDDLLTSAGVGGTAFGTLRRDHGGRAQWHRAVATALVHGLDVDVDAVLPGARPAPLPPYAFRRTRYWLDAPAPGTDLAASGLDRADHPVLGTAVELPDSTVLAGRVAGGGWVDDHEIVGHVLLPGTAVLDMVLSTGRGVRRLVLERPLPVGSGSRVRLVVAGDEAVLSARPDEPADTPWTRHATAQLGSTTAADDEAGAWPPAGAEVCDVDGLYARLAERGYAYGPAFRVVRAAWTDGDDLLVEAALPAGVDPRGHAVHPALLDGPLHVLIDRADGFLLPFTWSDVAVGAVGAAGATALRVRCRPVGDEVEVVAHDPGGVHVLTGRVLLAPSTRRNLTAAVAAAAGDPGDPLLVVQWQAAGTTAGAAGEVELHTVDAGEPHACAREVLARVQAFLATDGDTRLVVVTRGAVATGPAEHADGLAAATAWGLVRSAQTENPGRLVLLDTDGSLEPVEALRGDEPQLAVRGGEVLVPRLVPRPVPPLDLPDDRSWRLGLPGAAGIDRLALEPAGVREPGEGEARIAVRAAGVNFRDVTIATGMLPDEREMGIEAAGVVVGTGPGVDLAVGDRVVGLVDGAFSPSVTADARRLVRLPADWTFAGGATVPVVYGTAWQCLVDVARVQPGERVLVHAAAGGVGTAAVALARHLGAEVYGTASPAKWGGVDLDDDHLATSRDAGELEATIRAATGGEGVDVVLNSLAGEFVDASLRLLRDGGRFVEMGKTDLRDPAEVAREHPGVRYAAYNLRDLDAAAIAPLLAQVIGADGVEPLPLTAWDVRRAPETLRHLGGGHGTGKHVLTMPRALDPDGTVLITGGTGTLGVVVARHLAERHGVRHLVLVSRSGGEVDVPGARVVACDVADRAAVDELVASLEHPLTAVVHAAGLLDDALVTHLDAERLDTVLRPKVDAAQVLAAATAHTDLAAFVLFSSAAGILGDAGQANYAAANAWLDSFAASLRAGGVPAVSLAWGFWATRSGMTAHLSDADVARMRRAGMSGLEVDDALAMLDAALAGADAAVVPLAVDRAALGGAEAPAILRALAAAPAPARRSQAPAETPQEDPTTLLDRLADADETERGRLVLDLVVTETAVVLGHDGRDGAVGPDTAFRDAGFDSLTGVELRNRLAGLTGLRLSASLVSENPTPAELSRFLVGQLSA